MLKVRDTGNGYLCCMMTFKSVLESGRPVSHIAKDLGVSFSMLGALVTAKYRVDLILGCFT